MLLSTPSQFNIKLIIRHWTNTEQQSLTDPTLRVDFLVGLLANLKFTRENTATGTSGRCFNTRVYRILFAGSIPRLSPVHPQAKRIQECLQTSKREDVQQQLTKLNYMKQPDKNTEMSPGYFLQQPIQEVDAISPSVKSETRSRLPVEQRELRMVKTGPLGLRCDQQKSREFRWRRPDRRHRCRQLWEAGS